MKKLLFKLLAWFFGMLAKKQDKPKKKGGKNVKKVSKFDRPDSPTFGHV